MYKAAVPSNVRKINPECGSDKIHGLESSLPGQVGYTRMTTANIKPFGDRNTFQNHSSFPSHATLSEPMSEYVDSELQLPMPRYTPHRLPKVMIMPRPSSLPWNVSGPSQIAQNTLFASTTTAGPYRRTSQTNLVNSPYEKNVVQEYYNPMMRRQSQSTLPMMTIPQSPAGQMMQNEMPSRSQVQDVRFSPYPRPPAYAHTSTLSGFTSDQTFIMQSTKGGLPLPIATSKGISVKSTKATTTANTNKENDPTMVNNHRFFAGTIEQIVRWYKMARQADLHIMYKTAGVLESVMHGKWGERVLVLRDHREPDERLDEGVGPASTARPLQLAFFPIDRDLPPGIVVGQIVTCVGRMLGENRLQVLDAEPTTVEALVGLKRVSFLCQWALQEAVSV